MFILVAMKGGVIVARGLSSLRIERLNMLLGTLRKREYVAKNELLVLCGYTSARTLEDDINFLRKIFGAKIRYSRSKLGYIFENAGKYILDI